jgi:hypothetical protein
MRLGRRSRSGTVVVCLAVGALAAWPSGALARKRKTQAAAVRACVDDYKSGLALLEAGQLISSREQFVRCSKAACGITLRQECTTRFTQLDTEIPSLVPVATDAEGAPRFDVAVKMDGQLLTGKLDGRAWQLDPGRHELSFSADGEVFSTQEVLVVQGQRNRTVQATLTTPEKRGAREKKAAAVADAIPAASRKPRDVTVPPAEAVARDAVEREPAQRQDGAAEAPPLEVTAKGEPRSRMPALTYVLGGTGVIGLAGFGLLTYWGRKDADILASCSPSCAQSSADHIHRFYVASDVSLGVGVAALVGAYWAYAHNKSVSQKEDAATETAYVFGIAPTAAGAVGAISGTF